MAQEEEGEPKLFALITWVGEIWESILEEEAAATSTALEEAAQKEKAARLEAEQKARAAAAAKNAQQQHTSEQKTFATERERRDYAIKMAAGASTGGTAGDSGKKGPSKGKQFYKTGVSDDELIKECFHE